MKKLLFLFILSPILLLGSILFTGKINTEEPVYLVSDLSFEHSSDTGEYYEDQNKSATYKSPAGNLLGYVWTKTGKLINIFRDLCNLGDLLEKKNQPSPFAQSSGPYQFFKAGNETVSMIFKTLGPGQEILFASHHPWIFFAALCFGTILLSLWFLRLSTGVSPPVVALS